MRHSSEDGDPQWGGDKETAEENIILINRQRQVSQDKCRYQLLCSSPLGTLTQFVKSSLLAHACDPLSFSQSILSYNDFTSFSSLSFSSFLNIPQRVFNPYSNSFGFNSEQNYERPEIRGNHLQSFGENYVIH